MFVRIRNRLQNVDRREALFLGLYAAVMIAFPAIPFFAHAPRPDCRQFMVAQFFHTNAYHLVFRVWTFNQHQIWELWAIIQATAISVLLFFEIPEKQGIRVAIAGSFLIALTSVGAIHALGTAAKSSYQVLLIMIAVLMLCEDFYLHKKFAAPSAKDIIIFIDIPVFVSLVIVNLYVSFPVRAEHEPFLSGAVAFELVMANLVIVIVRTREVFSSKRRSGITDVTGAQPTRG